LRLWCDELDTPHNRGFVLPVASTFEVLRLWCFFLDLYCWVIVWYCWLDLVSSGGSRFWLVCFFPLFSCYVFPSSFSVFWFGVFFFIHTKRAGFFRDSLFCSLCFFPARSYLSILVVSFAWSFFCLFRSFICSLWWWWSLGVCSFPLFVHTSLHHLVSTSFVFLQAIMAIAKEKCWLGLNLICLAITFNKMLMK
jgi:hypothetical protein